MRFGGFRRGRKTPREQLQANLAAERFYAGSLPENDPRVLHAHERVSALDAAIPPKRHQVRRPVDGKPAIPYERNILAAILQALRYDPRVGFVWRQMAGTFQDGDRYIKAGPAGMPDVLGVLKDSGRLLAIEVKRLGQKPDERQAQRLEHLAR